METIFLIAIILITLQKLNNLFFKQDYRDNSDYPDNQDYHDNLD